MGARTRRATTRPLTPCAPALSFAEGAPWDATPSAKCQKCCIWLHFVAPIRQAQGRQRCMGQPLRVRFKSSGSDRVGVHRSGQQSTGFVSRMALPGVHRPISLTGHNLCARIHFCVFRSFVRIVAKRPARRSLRGGRRSHLPVALWATREWKSHRR